VMRNALFRHLPPWEHGRVTMRRCSRLCHFVPGFHGLVTMMREIVGVSGEHL
jgi:hypothetical protein